MRPIILQGSRPFSSFRLASLASRLQAANPGQPVETIDVVEIFLLDPGTPHDPGEAAERRIRALLQAEGSFTRRDGFFVTPRKGTISPWSSKATDIFRNCGLAQIRAVERGLHYRLLDADGCLVPASALGAAAHVLHDRMTEGIYENVHDFFSRPEPAPLRSVPLAAEGVEALRRADRDWGLALSPGEIDYLAEAFRRLDRDPTDAELVMFSQVNSEHCRHKIFNAGWVLDGRPCERTLFQMIRNTHRSNPDGTLVAYTDNSGVLEGFEGPHWAIDAAAESPVYREQHTQIDILCKVETHNHPTAISPYAGAATGVGGEIRDEGSTGTGGRSKAGLAAFMVSHLRIPEYPLPWETEAPPFPARLATPLEIMLDGPIGGAAFGNEFGRPQLCGLFRTFETVANQRLRGYHKPIMAAGGLGNLKREHVSKKDIPPKASIIQLGGPSMKIGLGGGAASSIASGEQSEELDFDSVQRGNPEMQRRCQQVIDACTALGSGNPILSIHDIGAGGLSNGLPELVEATGGRFHLRRIHSEDTSMSPMEIWCNESQERYVLGVLPEDLSRFERLCLRERCPFAVVGETGDDGRIVLHDELFDNTPIDMEMGVLLGNPPKMRREANHLDESHAPFATDSVDLEEAIDRVLRFPAVADKTFLITIADRSITGMAARDQMVGPWQIPVADAAVTTTTLRSTTGEAMAMGERTPLAVLSGPASARIAIGECLTNLAAAAIGPIHKIKLSANWMAAAGEPGEDANLYDTVRAVGLEFCPALGLAIPVGKDSMSMRTGWRDAHGGERKQTAPLSLLVTGFAPVRDAGRTLTPDLKTTGGRLLCIDLGAGRNRLGGSALAQVYDQLGAVPPDVEEPGRLAAFFHAIQELNTNGQLLAYHDRSDGGLFTTVAEMAFAGHKGVHLEPDSLLPENGGRDHLPAILFNEELGAVVEVAPHNLEAVTETLARFGLDTLTHRIGHTTGARTLTLLHAGEPLLEKAVIDLHRAWSELSFHMRARRDDPGCAREEYDRLLDPEDNGLRAEPAFDPDAPFRINTGARPRVAIFREQGVNGHNEMAAAFHAAGFEAVDCHMTDLLEDRVRLDTFTGLAACGGFSYGDVLGAGAGWAKSILHNERLKEQFAAFFARADRFTLGVCNGCQMLSRLKELIPGAGAWPAFQRNRSEQFEARTVTVEVLDSPSVFFRGMAGSRLPIPVAHGEGQADFEHTGDLQAVRDGHLACARYIDSRGEPADQYPGNPNGSPLGLTAFTTPDGRATILMPHPERCFRAIQMSWRPAGTFPKEAGPWLRMFQNARRFVE